VLILDRAKQPYTRADASTFHLLQDGVPQTIQSVEAMDAPVSLCLLIDNSASTRTIHSQISDAVTAVVKDLPPGSEVMAVQFGWKSSVVLPFTPAASVDPSVFAQLKPDGGNAVFDAVLAADTYLAKHAHHERRAVVLINDGDENASNHSLEDVERSLLSPGGALLYVLNIPDQWSISAHSVPYEHFMKIINGMGDGLVFDARGEKDVLSRAAEISEAIRSQYVLTYTSTDTARDGRLHQLDLRIVQGKTRLQIHGLPAYYAPGRPADPSVH
jgi:Ca-activated chloride channel family protein